MLHSFSKLHWGQLLDVKISIKSLRLHSMISFFREFLTYFSFQSQAQLWAKIYYTTKPRSSTCFPCFIFWTLVTQKKNFTLQKNCSYSCWNGTIIKTNYVEVNILWVKSCGVLPRDCWEIMREICKWQNDILRAHAAKIEHQCKRVHDDRIV